MIRTEIGDVEKMMIKDEGEFEIVLLSSEKYPFLSGLTLRTKDTSDPVVLLKNLQSAVAVQFPENTALKKKLLYIDMRFGNKIFFGFEN